jgi:hypothetical protein
MSIKHILSITALAGALATTSSIAHADHERGRRTTTTTRVRTAPDVLGTATIRRHRGVAEFTVTPNLKRDGLQLLTDADGLRIRSLELEYDDGRIVTFKGSILLDGLVSGRLLTIQKGRPGGLRMVRVKYIASSNDRGAKLSLIQIHTGDGYSKESYRDFASDHFDRPALRVRSRSPY